MESPSTITVVVTETSTPVITKSVYPIPASQNMPGSGAVTNQSLPSLSNTRLRTSQLSPMFLNNTHATTMANHTASIFEGKSSYNKSMAGTPFTQVTATGVRPYSTSSVHGFAEATPFVSLSSASRTRAQTFLSLAIKLLGLMDTVKAHLFQQAAIQAESGVWPYCDHECQNITLWHVNYDISTYCLDQYVIRQNPLTPSATTHCPGDVQAAINGENARSGNLVTTSIHTPTTCDLPLKTCAPATVNATCWLHEHTKITCPSTVVSSQTLMPRVYQYPSPPNPSPSTRIRPLGDLLALNVTGINQTQETIRITTTITLSLTRQLPPSTAREINFSNTSAGVSVVVEQSKLDTFPLFQGPSDSVPNPSISVTATASHDLVSSSVQSVSAVAGGSSWNGNSQNEMSTVVSTPTYSAISKETGAAPVSSTPYLTLATTTTFTSSLSNTINVTSTFEKHTISTRTSVKTVQLLTESGALTGASDRQKCGFEVLCGMIVALLLW